MKMVMISLIMVVLLIGLLIPIWSQFQWKRLFYYGALCFSIFFFIKAHAQSDFSETRKKPNSLVYFEDNESDKAYWTTYDKNLDAWTSKFIDESDEKFPYQSPYSKYGVNYQAYSETVSKQLPVATIEVLRDSTFAERREMKIKMTPNRRINLIDLQGEQFPEFYTIRVNGKELNYSKDNKAYRGTANESFLRYTLPYAQDHLEIELIFDKDYKFPITVLEYSFDLMEHPLFSLEPREAFMMPKPFVVTDAVITRQIFEVE